MAGVPSITRSILGIVAVAAACSLSSCAQHFLLTSPTQLTKLPLSRGLNGGSFAAETPWKYRGSTDRTHEFYYYYHIDNLLERRKVSIPRADATLDFQETPLTTMPRWVILRQNSTQFHFLPHRSATNISDGFSD